MDFDTVVRTSASVRTFTDRPVTDDVLHAILDAARFAPSGSNTQPWRVIVVRDGETRRSLRDLFQLSWREYWAHVLVGLRPFAPIDNGSWSGPAIDLDAARATPAPSDFVDRLDEHPCVLVVAVELAQLAVTDNGLDRQSIVGGGSIYPFAHNIVLAARNLGLGGTMTTVLCRQEPAAKALLGIPDTWAIAALVVLGEPVHQVTKLRRRPVESFTVIDTFGGREFG